MMYRILLSLLSVGMVANTIQAAEGDKLPYFQFRKGSVYSDEDSAHCRPLFWPAWASQTMCTSDDAKAAAFIQRMQELSENSRAVAKEGIKDGFAMGGTAGAILGALCAGFRGIRGIHMPGDRHANNKDFNYYAGCIVKKSLQILAGAALGAATGGTITAAVTASTRVYRSLDRANGYSCRYLEGYCKDAQDNALYQLKDAPGLSPETKTVIEKLFHAKFTRTNVTLSDEENRILNESTIPFDSTAIFEEENKIEPCPTPATIPQILQAFQDTDKQHRERVLAIHDGSGMASAYARKHKWRTFMPAGKNISTLTRRFNVLDAKKQRKQNDRNMKYTYENVSDLVKQWNAPGSEYTPELGEQIITNAAKFKRMYRSYHDLPEDTVRTFDSEPLDE